MIGKRLGGRYQVEEKVGGGGMAVVYKAQDLLLNRTVAVKVLRSEYGHDEDFIRRFRREAQAAASLSHPNVVSVYDVGEDDEDTYFMVLEYIKGSTLKDMIRKWAPLETQEAIYIATEICKALDHAHHNKIIHRDIKPHNILIGANGKVKVTDFGIARAVTSATITHTGSVVGSVHYFSPEQARGGATGEKSDIYSLGVVLYEMLTGELPFSGESPISVALKHLQDPFQDPRELNPEIPQSVENIILKALAKDVSVRYQSAKEMLEDLQTCLSPERQNEKKLILPSYDPEATKTMPAITDEMLQANHDRDSFLEDEDEDSDESRSRFPWVKTISWLFAIILLFCISVWGISYIKSVLYVPDVSMPRLNNDTAADAKERLESLGLEVKIEKKNDPEVEKGLVIKTTPAAGTIVKKNSVATLYVSLGQKSISMPKLTGLLFREAKLELEDFKDVKKDEEFSDQFAVGEVIRQTPEVGEDVVPENTVVLVAVSKGKEDIEMPSLVGLTKAEAESKLLQYNLSLGKVTEEKGYQDKGHVIWQFPYQPGDMVPLKSEVNIGISTGFPDDAIQYVEPVLLMLDQSKKVDILILVTDARGDEQVAVKTTVDQTTSFDVSLVLSPEQNGIIQVYEDNSFLKKINVRYDEVGGN